MNPYTIISVVTTLTASKKTNKDKPEDPMFKIIAYFILGVILGMAIAAAPLLLLK